MIAFLFQCVFCRVLIDCLCFKVVVLVFRFAVSALVLAPGFKPRTILQLIIGMLFVFVYFVLVVRADPMLERKNNSFNSFVILQLLFTVSVR